MAIFSCGGQRPDNLGVNNGKLAPCPAKSNCVCSNGCDHQHAVAPFVLKQNPERAWQSVMQTVRQLPRTTIVTQTEHYLHAECSSAVFGFIDDLELYMRPDDNIIDIRSASRLGEYDFGVNRKRVETLRKLLQQQNIIR